MIIELIGSLVNELVIRLTKIHDNNLLISKFILVTVLLYVLNDYFGKPPRHLRHLPYNNAFITIWKVITGVPTRNISRDLSLPFMKNPDCHMYVRLERLGWTVHVMTPQAAKVLLTSSSKNIKKFAA